MAWGGLGIPKKDLTKEQRLAIKGLTKLPENSSDALKQFLTFFEEKIVYCLDKHGYDPTRDYSSLSPFLGQKRQKNG